MTPGRSAWLLLREDAPLTRGRTRVHPAIPGVLHPDAGTSPLDLHELTAKATTDPFAYARLRALL